MRLTAPFCWAVLALCLAFAHPISAQTSFVSTLAGSGPTGQGNGGYVDGPGNLARFSRASSVAMDAAGNLYVADRENNRIRKITPLGEVSTFAGSGNTGYANGGFQDGPGNVAQFNVPTGIAVDATGNVYVADFYNNRIRKISPSGVVSTLAGSGVAGYQDGPAITARFNGPAGIAVDSVGNVYVAEYRNNLIRKITPSGIVSTFAGDGTIGYQDGPSSTARFYYPYDVDLDAAGNVYVADYYNHCIRKISPSGLVSTVAGNGTIGFQDGPGSMARFYYPNGFAVDAAGTVYVADTYNQRIRKISPSGLVTTLAGNGTAGYQDGQGSMARFSNPIDVVEDAAGNVFVADFNNHRIRKITSNGFALELYNDLNANCSRNTQEAGVAGIGVSLQPNNYVGFTDVNGMIIIADSLPNGTYTATIDSTHPLWQANCGASQTFTIVNGQPTAPIAFGLTARFPCAEPNVSITMPIIRRGFAGQPIYVQACNALSATGAHDSAYVIVELDSNISVQSGSLPYTTLGGNRFRVDVGTLNPGQCVSFQFSSTVSLNAQMLQTLCMAAELFPQPECVFDTTPTPYQVGSLVPPCTSQWDRSSLSVSGRCVGDSVRFVIRNTGSPSNGNMQCQSPVRVLLDGQLIQQASVQLNGGDSAVFVFAGNGQTWRLEADQHPLHPGHSRPNAVVENCGSGNWTPGIIPQLPPDDADPIIDRFCGQVSAPFDPNDKTGFPTGWGATNNILRNQDIEYLIRFQNVGTDTAFTVVIRDTLSTSLDIFSVRSGAGSAPYSFRVYGPRVLEWTFSNIQLPDSNSNEPASHGFVTFRVRQNADLPYGTVINNSAGIYFDFEAPVITNTTQHTVSPPPALIPSGLSESLLSGLRIFPNPTSGQLTVDLGAAVGQPATVRVLSITGQVIQTHSLPAGTLTHVLDIAAPGLYLVEVRTADHLRTEKVVVY